MAPGLARLAMVEQQVVGLTQQLATLEAKPHVKFVGVFEPGRTYEAGDAATHNGGLWVCKVRTSGKPGEDFVAWQLAVKRGAA